MLLRSCDGFRTFMRFDRHIKEELGRLKYGEMYTRKNAAEALDRIGKSAKDAVPALIKALSDGVKPVRVRPSANRPSTLSLGGRCLEEICCHAASALGKIGDPTAVPSLIKALGDGDDMVRAKVADALKKIATPEALKAVEEYEKRQKDAENRDE